MTSLNIPIWMHGRVVHIATIRKGFDPLYLQEMFPGGYLVSKAYKMPLWCMETDLRLVKKYCRGLAEG